LIAEELLDLAGRYGGLGMTGEALVLLRTGDEEAVVLHPVRHGDTGPVTLELGDPSADPFARALAGPGASLWDGATDYRGVAVWAATRHVPETSWGVVVKVDAQEEEAPIADFRARLARLGLSISAFAILLGTILGLRFAKPIHDLAEVAEEIKSGELSARAKVTRQDEIGVLARTFNEMADELEARMVSLQEYRKFFDVSLDMLCVAGTDGYFKRTNPSFERILGWPEEELLARPFLEITHPDDIEATLRELEKLAEGIPTVSFENRFRCADGTYKCLLWTSYPDPDTGLLYAIAHEVVEGAKNRG
jgi:PAS domain S-box-containing protein